MGGVERLEFDLRTPVDEETIRAQIAACHARGLPNAVQKGPVLNIVATGPSARALPPLDGPVCAVNGALALVPNPDYYAACDPQEAVVEFLRDPPAGTTYLIASKCHPAVFDALADREVGYWDLDDYVPGGIASAPSITLAAMNLFVERGWRRFAVWGWDCCYGPDGAHHAGSQPASTSEPMDVTVGDRVFSTNRTWVHECESAGRQLAVYDYLHIEVVIHGDSMLKAIREFMTGRR